MYLRLLLLLHKQFDCLYCVSCVCPIISLLRLFYKRGYRMTAALMCGYNHDLATGPRGPTRIPEVEHDTMAKNESNLGDMDNNSILFRIDTHEQLARLIS